MKKNKLSFIKIVLLFMGIAIIPNIGYSQSVNNNNPITTATKAGMEEIMKKIGIDTLDRIYKQNPCNKIDDSNIELTTETNINSSNYVPVTSDIMEKSLQRIENSLDYMERYAKWMQEWTEKKECDLDITSSQMQAMFLAKFKRDTEAAINKEIFAGNPAFIPNRNSWEQRVADDVISSMFYDNVGFENACSYNVQPIKMALNVYFASENKSQISNLIGESVCTLKGDKSQHESIAAAIRDPSSASWSDFKDFENNPFIQYNNLREGAIKAIRNETVQANKSTKNGFMTLYKCSGTDKTEDVLSRKGEPNFFYRVTNNGNCVAINPAHVIEQTYLDILDTSTKRMYDAGGNFGDIVPKILELNSAYYPPLDSKDGIVGGEYDKALAISAKGISELKLYNDQQATYTVSSTYTTPPEEGWGNNNDPNNPNQGVGGGVIGNGNANDPATWNIWEVLKAVVKFVKDVNEVLDNADKLSSCISNYQESGKEGLDDTKAVDDLTNILDEIIRLQGLVNAEAAVVEEARQKMGELEMMIQMSHGVERAMYKKEFDRQKAIVLASTLDDLQNNLQEYLNNNASNGPNSIQGWLDKCNAIMQ